MKILPTTSEVVPGVLLALGTMMIVARWGALYRIIYGIKLLPAQ